MSKEKTIKITVEVPELTMCAFVNYVYFDSETGGQFMGSKAIETDAIDKARKENEQRKAN